MIDNGTQLTNLGMQLNMIGSQIQNISTDISLINNNFSIQLQNIGIQISKFSQQIFNIGMLIKNISSMQQPFGAQMDNMMNNNMNIRNFNNVNIGMNINNNDFENMNDINKGENEIICIIFENHGFKTSINISQDKTIKELLNAYRERIGADLDFFEKNYFLHNGIKINPNEKRTILEYGIMKGNIIIVVDYKNFTNL